MHSNPIIVTFCSLLYYEDLSDHIRNHRMEKIIKPLDKSVEEFYILRPSNFDSKPLNEFKMHPLIENSGYQPKRNYNRKILNRWHLFLRLSLNIELTIYRKHRITRSLKENDSNKFLPLKVIVMMDKLKQEITDRTKAKTDQVILETKF